MSRHRTTHDRLCDYCRKPDPSVLRRPDPFQSEIHGDDTLHWLCDDCYQEAAWEI